jgi:hypothetical protein
MERRLAAILAADVVGYSRLMGGDEEATLATLNAYPLAESKQSEMGAKEVFTLDYRKRVLHRRRGWNSPSQFKPICPDTARRMGAREIR